MTSLTFNPDNALALTAPADALAFLKEARNAIADECAAAATTPTGVSPQRGGPALDSRPVYRPSGGTLDPTRLAPPGWPGSLHVRHCA